MTTEQSRSSEAIGCARSDRCHLRVVSSCRFTVPTRGFGSIGFLVTLIGVYPGSFNPPTKAHLEIAFAAVSQHALKRLDFALSRRPLGKATAEVPSFAHRLEVVEQSLLEHERLAVVVTEEQLISDIADGYDVVVMGADKWHQVHDPYWYKDDTQARDSAVDRLPTVALAPRPPHVIPAALQLPVSEDLIEISSTAARSGHTDQMTLAAAQFDAETGAWTNPAKYQLWHSSEERADDRGSGCAQRI